jgi:hypothetical protein
LAVLECDPPAASTTTAGIVELATDAETEAGTDTARAITPSNLRTVTVYKSDYNAKGDILSASANDTPSILSVGTSGQYLSVSSATTTGLVWSTPGFVDIDDISSSFDGVTTSFAIQISGVGYTPTSSTNLMVFLGGVAQIPGASNAYIISGSNISFTTAPTAGMTFYATTIK